MRTLALGDSWYVLYSLKDLSAGPVCMHELESQCPQLYNADSTFLIRLL